MKINKLPGAKGFFIANTEKKTKMYRYQVTGSKEELALYYQAKEAEGYPAKVDEEYGTLYLTSRNLGREATLETYITDEGKLVITSYNQDLRDIEDLRTSGVSQAFLDNKIVEALSKGSYAKKITVVAEETAEPTENTGEQG